jgi:hypothetical protein
MNSDKVRFYRGFAYTLKRRYPHLKIYLDVDSGFLRQIIEPKYLYITKSNYQFNAIFTYRRYANIAEMGLNKFNPKDHDLLFDGYMPHEKFEINKSLLPYFKETHFSEIIYSKVDKHRRLYDDNEDLLEDKDQINFDMDLIKFVNSVLLQSALGIYAPEESFNGVAKSDLEVYGTDMYEMIKFLSNYSFAANSNFMNDKVILDLNYHWGEDMIELIIQRSLSFHGYVNDHFLQWRMDAYVDGDDIMLSLLRD